MTAIDEGKIELREIHRRDLPAINLWRNDPEVIEHLGANFRYLAEEIDERWFERYLGARETAVRLAIVHRATGKHIGNVNLTDIQTINRCAEFSIFIGDKPSWSQGLGAEATAKMLRHAFGDLNLHRVYLYVLTQNQRAIRMYEKLGFVTEGKLRDAVFKQGGFRDLLVMSVLAGEAK